MESEVPVQVSVCHGDYEVATGAQVDPLAAESLATRGPTHS